MPDDWTKKKIARHAAKIATATAIANAASGAGSHAGNHAPGGSDTLSGYYAVTATVATNSTHVAGDGSDHADVAANTAKQHDAAHASSHYSGGGDDISAYYATTQHAATHPPGGTDALSSYYAVTAHAASHDTAGTASLEAYYAVTPIAAVDLPASLKSGQLAADHGTAATDMIVNVCYGTGNAPTANTTTIGTLYVKYTA